MFVLFVIHSLFLSLDTWTVHVEKIIEFYLIELALYEIKSLAPDVVKLNEKKPKPF